MIQKLLNSFGEELLRYAFAIHDNENFPANEKKLDKETLDFLISCISHDSPGFGISLSMILRYIPEYEMTVLNHLYIKNKGSPLITKKSKDNLLNILYKLLYDVWPVYLYNPLNEREYYSPKCFIINSAITSSLYNHPLITSFCESFMKDQSLKRLFPGIDISELESSEYITKISAQWLTNIGNGGTQQILNVISSLFFQTATRCIINEGKIDYILLCKYLEEVLADLRKFANKEEVEMFVLCGLEGFTMDENVFLKFENVIIRPPTKYELSILLNYNRPPQLVVEKKIPISLRVLKVNSTQEEIDEFYQKGFTEWNKIFSSIQQEVDKVRLSLVLSSDIENKQFITPIENSRFIESPVRNSVQMYELNRFDASANACLTKDMVKKVEDLYPLIVFNKLNFGIKRLLSAVGDRPDPNDAFIDAIIVWENVFGVKSETTFRITASLAKLLEDTNVEKRNELQKRLKKLYSKRSNIIHGVEELPVEKSQELKNEALSISIKTLKILFQDRRDLIECKPEIRSQTILLEGRKSDK